MATGTLKWFSDEKGFGYIRPDEALAARGYRFCRYSDDFRFFVASEREGREILAFLARALSNNHGLTLQAAKTEFDPRQELQRALPLERAGRGHRNDPGEPPRGSSGFDVIGALEPDERNGVGLNPALTGAPRSAP
jgi:hypothetical protein